jgi:hypothetical protein
VVGSFEVAFSRIVVLALLLLGDPSAAFISSFGGDFSYNLT